MKAAPGSGVVNSFFLYRDYWSEGLDGTEHWNEIDIELLGQYTNRVETNLIIQNQWDLPDHSVINGSLGLTEPSTSTFGIKATDIGETYPITLSNVNGTTQTQDSNTFSVYVGDYYLVRSRVSGELIDIANDVNAYTKPDSDMVFGNAVAWGSSVAGDETCTLYTSHAADKG